MKVTLRTILMVTVALTCGCATTVSHIQSIRNTEDSRTERLRHWIREDPKRNRLLVFVHGFNSSRETAWESFPKLVEEDPGFDEYNILLYGYDSEVCGQVTDIEHTGEGLASYLLSISQKYQSIIFIGHSMGGLVALHSIIAIHRQDKERLTRIPTRVLTFGTPHDGVLNASTLTLVCPNRQAEDMHVQSLPLHRLKRDWNERFGPGTGLMGKEKRLVAVHPYYGAADQFVPQATACSGFDANCLQVDGNHVTMVKPRSRDHQAYYKLQEAKDMVTTDTRPISPSKPSMVIAPTVPPLPEAGYMAPPSQPLPNEWLSPMDQAVSLLVPGGEFTRGNDLGDEDERPQRTIFVDSFYMDKYEVTTYRYDIFLKATSRNAPPYWAQAGQDDNSKKPVIGISYEDAEAYCEWAKKRLPTEAEWEKAARGTDGRVYPWGNDAPTDVLANYSLTTSSTWRGYASLADVDSFPKGKSPYGIFNLAGNAYEWVQDWYDPDYYKNPQDRNPSGPMSAPVIQARVYKGGSWHQAKEKLRSSDRGYNRPEVHLNYVGFRCVKSAEELGGHHGIEEK